MEIRTCEEYVLNELDVLQKDNAHWLDYAGKMKEERDALKAERDALAKKVAELNEQLAIATEQASAAIIRANELQRASAPEFEPVREVPDGD